MTYGRAGRVWRGGLRYRRLRRIRSQVSPICSLISPICGPVSLLCSQVSPTRSPVSLLCSPTSPMRSLISPIRSLADLPCSQVSPTHSPFSPICGPSSRVMAAARLQQPAVWSSSIPLQWPMCHGSSGRRPMGRSGGWLREQSFRRWICHLYSGGAADDEHYITRCYAPAGKSGRICHGRR